MGNDRLPRPDAVSRVTRLHLQPPTQYEGIFVELRGLRQPGGLVIRATLSADVCELNRPINSSMTLGGSPAAARSVGLATSVVMFGAGIV